MAFQAEQKPINHLLTNNVLGIPRNQRLYVWKKDNWQDLLSDIEFIIKSEEGKNHFIGSIVLKQEAPINGLNSFTIIDGQQRTITILLLLSSILKLFQENEMKEDFMGTIQYLISKDRKNIEYCVLSSESHVFVSDFISKVVNYSDMSNINNLIEKSVIDHIKEKNLTECVKYFYNALKQAMEESPTPKKYLVSIKDAILDTNYVRITADTEEDSYTIFEILNARGLALADHELLKNYIMRYILPKNQIDVVKRKWEWIERELGTSINRFFKHYAVHKIKTTNKEQVYKTIQKAYSKERVSELLDDLTLKIKYYTIILYPEKDGEKKNCSPLEYKILKFLKAKRAEQFRPIILGLMNKKDAGILTEDRYNEVLRFLFSFFVCYNIIGEEKSNKLEDTIYKYAPIIENDYSDIELANFIDSLKKKTPTLKTFEEKFRLLGWSNHYDFYRDSKNKERVKTVLELLESYYTGVDYIDDFTLEHIFPDSQDTSNALIENIIPLEENYNKNCKDKTFVEKLPYYAQSRFKLARNIAEKYNNKEFDVNVRMKYMAETIYKDVLKL